MTSMRERAFIVANTRLVAPPFVPEIQLRLADDALELWRRLEAALGERPPLPYWGFAWAGGLALARHLLDHPDLVRGRRVLDLASGSGLVAIAAAKAGAAAVTAADVDRWAVEAIALNAEANGEAVATVLGDALGGDGAGADIVLAGDVFYEQPLAERVMSFLERVRARRAEVSERILVAEPERDYLPAWFPRPRFRPVASYDVPVGRAIEDEDVKRTTVWAPAWARPRRRAAPGL
jgi:predicted nicotinamide N-methyase